MNEPLDTIARDCWTRDEVAKLDALAGIESRHRGVARDLLNDHDIYQRLGPSPGLRLEDAMATALARTERNPTPAPDRALVEISQALIEAFDDMYETDDPALDVDAERRLEAAITKLRAALPPARPAGAE